MRRILNQFQNFHAALIQRWIVSFRSRPVQINAESVMIFAAHQDDETLGCGGTIALKRERQAKVGVVFLTNGQLGASACLAARDVTAIRHQEAIKALELLGVPSSDIHFLDQPDGSLEQLNEHQAQQVIDTIIQLLNRFQPVEVYVHYRKDRHKDHEATYDLVCAAIAQSGVRVILREYPIRLLWQAPLFIDLKLRELSCAYRVAIHSVQDRKKRAIECHKSQIDILPRGFPSHFSSPYEIFFEAEPEWQGLNTARRIASNRDCK